MEAGGSSSAPSEGAGGSAPPTREELHILFTRGVRCILGRWEVMTAAMQDGGGDSGKHPAQLFAELERETLINFDERWERSEAVDVGEVGDFLNDFVTEELGYDVAPSIYAQVRPGRAASAASPLTTLPTRWPRCSSTSTTTVWALGPRMWPRSWRSTSRR